VRFTVTCSHSNRSGEVSLSNDQQSASVIHVYDVLEGQSILWRNGSSLSSLCTSKVAGHILKQLAACMPGAGKPDYWSQTLSRGLLDGGKPFVADLQWFFTHSNSELQCVRPFAGPLHWVKKPVLLEWSSFKRSWIVASRRWRTWKLRWSRLLQWKVNGCEHGCWVGKHGKTCDMGVWSDRLL